MHADSTNPPTPQSTNTDPIDWQQAATSHLRRIGELMAERDAAEASRDRLRQYASELEGWLQHEDTTYPPVTITEQIADAQRQAGIQHGDLDGEGEDGDA